ncbi:hypothetical protein [Nonomuraea antri]|nr:hypothetical protein [Nonomuraea antri]
MLLCVLIVLGSVMAGAGVIFATSSPAPAVSPDPCPEGDRK